MLHRSCKRRGSLGSTSAKPSPPRKATGLRRRRALCSGWSSFTGLSAWSMPRASATMQHTHSMRRTARNADRKTRTRRRPADDMPRGVQGATCECTANGLRRSVKHGRRSLSVYVVRYIRAGFVVVIRSSLPEAVGTVVAVEPLALVPANCTVTKSAARPAVGTKEAKSRTDREHASTRLPEACELDRTAR